ncbi:MAG: hypothetical protein IJZ13_06855, partial [Clostridia bacterium]|nr:hypothetical protein [Clostridia bacterium]
AAAQHFQRRKNAGRAGTDDEHVFFHVRFPIFSMYVVSAQRHGILYATHPHKSRNPQVKK